MTLDDATAYVVTLLRDVPWSPLMLTRIGAEHRELKASAPTLLAAAEAILADYTGRPWSSADAAAFAAIAFHAPGAAAVAQTIQGATVARFVEAAERARAVA